MRNNNNNLVSIVVITYNSERYVLQTLESIKRQTYQNIELIISDDGSKDDTEEICKQWLDLNSKRFVRSKTLNTPLNTGIPANCNRGVKEANGEWIKFIAGDDILLPNCIINNIMFLQKSKKIKFLFSRISIIDEYGIKKEQLSDNNYLRKEAFFTLEAQKQYRLLIKGGVLVPAPSSFLNRKAIIDIGGYDEKFPLCEDYPMWIKATDNNIKLDFMDKVTVAYRVHSQSVMGNRSRIYESNMRQVFFKYRFKPLFKINPFLAIDLLIRNIIRTNRLLSKVIPYILPNTYFAYFKYLSQKSGS